MENENTKTNHTKRNIVITVIIIMLLLLCLRSCSKDEGISEVALPLTAVIDEEAVPLFGGNAGEELAALREQVDNTELAVREAVNELAIAQQELEAAVATNDTATDNVVRIQELVNDLEDAMKKLEEAEEEKAGADKELEAAKEALEAAQKELEEAKAAADEAAKKVDEIQEALEKAKAALGDARSKHEDACNAYGKELAALVALVHAAEEESNNSRLIEKIPNNGDWVSTNRTKNCDIVDAIDAEAKDEDDPCFVYYNELSEDGYYWKIFNLGVTGDIERDGLAYTYMPSAALKAESTSAIEKAPMQIVLKYVSKDEKEDGTERPAYYGIVVGGGVYFTDREEVNGKTVDTSIKSDDKKVGYILTVDEVNEIIEQLINSAAMLAELPKKIETLEDNLDEAEEEKAGADAVVEEKAEEVKTAAEEVKDAAEAVENAAAAVEEAADHVEAVVDAIEEAVAPAEMGDELAEDIAEAEQAVAAAVDEVAASEGAVAEAVADADEAIEAAAAAV